MSHQSSEVILRIAQTTGVPTADYDNLMAAHHEVKASGKCSILVAVDVCLTVFRLLRAGHVESN